MLQGYDAVRGGCGGPSLSSSEEGGVREGVHGEAASEGGVLWVGEHNLLACLRAVGLASTKARGVEAMLLQLPRYASHPSAAENDNTMLPLSAALDREALRGLGMDGDERRLLRAVLRRLDAAGRVRRAPSPRAPSPQ